MTLPQLFSALLTSLFAAIALLGTQTASAQGFFADAELSRAEKIMTPPTGPPGVQRLADIAYGPDPRQRMDVYLPVKPAQSAAVIVMVHGGAWMHGHKAMPYVVNNKVARWVVDSGHVLVSVDYRMVPQVNPLQQAHDVASALSAAQSKAASWGADPARIILMGHSAGAHLVALLAASPTLAHESGARPWLGTVALDSAALDLPRLMTRHHMPFYDRVFGAAPAFWQQVSPISVLKPGAAPILLVCSTQRPDDSCAQSRSFASCAQALGNRASVLEQNLSHSQINSQLGLPGAYTDAVDGFMSGLLAGR